MKDAKYNMIKIDFSFDTEHGVFKDAISLPDDHTLTESEIEEMKQQRVDAWISIITTPAIEEGQE